MNTVSEYRRHAEECRVAAGIMPAGPPRDHLLQLAENWERMAEARVELVRATPELAGPDGQEEQDRRDA